MQYTFKLDSVLLHIHHNMQVIDILLHLQSSWGMTSLCEGAAIKHLLSPFVHCIHTQCLYVLIGKWFCEF